MGPEAMILVYLIFSFKLALSLSSFTLIKRLFSSSLLSAIRVPSSVYLGWLIFLLAILITAYNSAIQHLAYSAYVCTLHMHVLCIKGAVAARAQEGQEELLHFQGQEERL